MHYLALMLDVLLLGAFFYVLMGGIRKKSRTAGRIMVVRGLLILVSLVNSLRTMIANSGGSLFLRFVEQRAPIIGVAIAILLVAALVFGGIRALRPVYKLLFLVSPFLFFTFGQTLYRNASFDDRLTAQWSHGPTARRPAGRRAARDLGDLRRVGRGTDVRGEAIENSAAGDRPAAGQRFFGQRCRTAQLSYGLVDARSHHRDCARRHLPARRRRTHDPSPGFGHLRPLERAGHGLSRGPEDGLQHRRSGLGDPLLPGAEERPLGLLVVERQQPIQQCGKHAAGDARPTWRAASTKTSTVRRSDNPFPPRGTVG